MATLQSTSITGSLTVDGNVVGGGKTLKYQEFTSSGTFTPTAAAISAGGVHQVFLVGGGERGNGNAGGCGGEVIETYVTLTSTAGCAVTIGAGGASNGADGGNSSVAFASAGGTSITALGGAGLNVPSSRLTGGAGGNYGTSAPAATISVTAPGATVVVFAPGPSNYYYAYAYQRAYASAYQSAYRYNAKAGIGHKGFGAGGRSAGGGGINTPKANTGAGSVAGVNASAGYCLITWYEE